MNLNGKNCQSKTILNGKPLYRYDAKKEQSKIKHHFVHQKIVQNTRNKIRPTPKIDINDNESKKCWC